jgi:hypothetical protein
MSQLTAGGSFMISKKTWPTWSLLILLLLGAIPKAHAIPAFSRQTGLSCAACHVGAFGPQLTPLGREFKLKGYMLKSGGGFNPKISAQVLESFLHTQKDQATPPAPGFNTNNNWELQTVDMYLAGPISDHMGLFTLASYSQNGHTVGWDMTDLRYARTSQLGAHSAIWGISLNNAPTITDIYNTAPAWQYPYSSGDLAPGAPATPIIMDAFANASLGLTAYTQIDDKWYLEAGGYRTLSRSFLNKVNGDYIGRLYQTAPYLRLAYQTNLNAQSNMEVGGMYFSPQIQPMGVGAGTDDYKDYGVDANYQWSSSDFKHSITLQGLYVYEKQTLNNTFAEGAASNLHNHLNATNINASYWYENTYGATLAAIANDGSSDALLYGGSPNTEGGVAEISWVPFGKDTSWKQPYINLRLGLQYTFYTKFAGDKNSASDNNATYLYFQTIF